MNKIFWEKEAQKLNWFKKWKTIISGNKPFERWFNGGQINASYQCLDRHIENGLSEKVAIYWENELGEKKQFSYKDLFAEVNKLALGFKKLGVKKGDVIILYMPMIPEAVISMLACARVGAIHNVVFSAFSYKSLKDRIIDTNAKFIITAEYALRRGKTLDLKFIVDLAIHNTSIEKVILVKRSNKPNCLDLNKDVLYQNLIENVEEYCQPEKMESNDPLFVLYTSGTTGKPKGIIHSTGGYLTYVNSTLEQTFGDIKDQVYWCTGDIGWITGHSYIVYGPLMHGSSVVLYEGTLDYPDPSVWWKIIQNYKVSIFYSSPTAIRMLRKLDEKWMRGIDISSLKKLGTVGEVINPDVWRWFFDKVGNGKCPIIDTWWQTETGGFMIAPKVTCKGSDLKPGSAGKSLAAIDIDIVDENGNFLKNGEKGFLVISSSWPGLTLGVWGDKKRYEETYWSKFKGCFYPGDYAIKDKNGRFWILGRSDETLNISGHRIGTAELENAAIKNRLIAEVAVAPIPDKLRGQNFVLFVVLKKMKKTFYEEDDDLNLLRKKIVKTLRSEIGALAKPAKIYFVDSLPKTRSGKIMRRVLSSLLQKGFIGDLSTLENINSIENIKMAIR